ncbi:DNA polymerase IV [Candidatus Microgenomates bacterium]|nr:DNA polymerase IV [Candidatus Microgenomates bacterium]
MNKIIFHIDFNSYFASVEQQANPRLRGKPIGVTGGDRMDRTVLGAASIEAKKFGVKTGMQIWQAKKLCPDIILVRGDSDKYLECTKRFLNILKGYSPTLEVFSIDEVFLELPPPVIAKPRNGCGNLDSFKKDSHVASLLGMTKEIAQDIKSRIKVEIGEYITCSIGISYNKLMAKLARSLQKNEAGYRTDGLVVIPDQETAIKVLDQAELDEICGIGSRIKGRLNNMGIFNFSQLRKVPLEALLASFKSYGQVLYNMARGVDNSEVVPFYEKEEVKSVGHRHTINHDTDDPTEIRQILLKLTEMIARRLRSKKLIGKTVSCWYREAFRMHTPGVQSQFHSWSGNSEFSDDGMQVTIFPTQDGLEIFKTAWGIFGKIWNGKKIRMIGASISNLKPINTQGLSLLPEVTKQETVLRAIDTINDKYGEFTLQRGILLGSQHMQRKHNPYLADRRFKL